MKRAPKKPLLTPTSEVAPVAVANLQQTVSAKSILPWVCFLLYAGTFIALASASWRKWPDGYIDFGLQLYTPWLLSEGKILGRELIYLPGGPLSQYFHGLLFKVFGVSFTTLFTANLCLVALFVWLLHWLFVKVSDRVTAVLICVVTLLAFAFGHLSYTGNYNYVCPYNYETFHGLFLSAAAIGCLTAWLRSGGCRFAFAAGLLSGCVFLTKPDLFLALAAALGVAATIRFVYRGNDAPASSRGVFLLLAGLAVPSAAFIVCYAAIWNAAEGLKAVAGAWLPLLTTSAAQNAFYKWCLGLDHPVQHLGQIAQSFGGLLISLLIVGAASRFRRPTVATAVVFWFVTLGSAYLAFRFGSSTWGPALGPATFAGCLLVTWRWCQSRNSHEGKALVFPMLWSVFALFVLAKMGLFTRIWHYGFYLAMPASAFVIYLLTWWLPGELERVGVRRNLFRSVIVVCLLAAFVPTLGFTTSAYQAKTESIGSGGDRIFVYGPQLTPSGIGVGLAVEWLKQNPSPNGTLAVFPEGVMVNYLARRINPTPYVHVTVAEIAAYGEKTILASYVAAPPDYVALFHRDSSEYGVGYFGKEVGFGYDIMQWVRANYTPVWTIGAEPLQTNQFGIAILKRNDWVVPSKP